MMQTTRLAAWLYALLLHLYPREFLDEFGDEMQQVFRDTMANAARQGHGAWLPICLRELGDLPIAVLREHWRARSKTMLEHNARVSWLELSSTAIPFVLYLALPIVEGLRWNGGGVVIIVLAGTLCILMVVGLFKGMPRWSLPTLGLFLAALNYSLFGLVVPNFNPVATAPFIVRQIFGAGFALVGILPLALVVILASAAIKPWRPLFQRMWQDWTLLPLALYGIMPLVMLLSFDEYQGDAPYQVGMGLILLAGLWLYLRYTRPWARMVALGTAITLGMAVEVLGKWMLVPSQQWSTWFQWHTTQAAIEIEVVSTVCTWLWAMVIVFVPALLGLLPDSTRLTTTTPS